MTYEIKYANIDFRGKECVNIGDIAQVMAVDFLYRSLGIPVEDVVKIPMDMLSTWESKSGEKYILPVNFPFLSYSEGGFASIFSDSIIPVFFGLTILKSNLTTAEINYLKKHEPIGCRDEYTYNNLRRAGVDAWLNGCITFATFGLNYKTKCKNKIYIVDVCDQLREYIPEAIYEKAIECSQYVQKKEVNEIGDIKKYVNKRYKEYSEAELIITSRLHLAIPCLAMGVPVVLAMEKVSFRFGWVEKILPIYTPSDFHLINWSPNLIEVGDIQNSILMNAQKMLLTYRANKTVVKNITSFWQERERKKYIIEGYDETIKYINEKWCRNDEIHYSFWGITFLTEMIDDYIQDKFPYAKFEHAFDAYRKIDFRGKRTENIEDCNEQELRENTVFVTASAATKYASAFFSKLGKQDGFFLCYGEFMRDSGNDVQ